MKKLTANSLRDFTGEGEYSTPERLPDEAADLDRLRKINDCVKVLVGRLRIDVLESEY